MTREKRGYQPSDEEMEIAESSMKDFEKMSSKKRESILSQTPEETRKLFTSLIDGPDYDDNMNGEEAKAYKKDLKLVYDALPDLEALGYEIKFSPTHSYHGNYPTIILLRSGNQTFELYHEYPDTYPNGHMQITQEIARGRAHERANGLKGKIEMAKWFGRIIKEQQNKE